MAEYIKYFSDKKFIISCFFSIVLILSSFIINFYAGTYAAKEAANPVTDIILSNTSPVDVDGTFVFGAMFLAFLITFLGLSKPQRIPFILNTIALFFIIRSVFISATHIGPFPNQIPLKFAPGTIPFRFISKFTFGADLFFSGHTGLPFLMAMIFWDSFFWRIFFIAMSIIFGIVVLLGHLHYSIDVLAAFFITYSIYRLAEIGFKRSKKMFDEGLV